MTAGGDGRGGRLEEASSYPEFPPLLVFLNDGGAHGPRLA